MIHVTIEQATGGVLTWLIPTLAGLIGAAIGGLASILSAGLANQHAVVMLRLERRESAADDLLAALWHVINQSTEVRWVRDARDDGVMIPGQDLQVDRKAVMGKAYDLANRCANDETHVQALCHEYAWQAGYRSTWDEFRAWSAALSAAITQWRTDPATFHADNQPLQGYLDELPEEMRKRDEAKAAGRPNPGTAG